MTRDLSTDGIAKELVDRYVSILSGLSGWGPLSSGGKAVYESYINIPPQEPFPCCYVYVAGVVPYYGDGTGVLEVKYTTRARILSGPVSPDYAVVQDTSIYTMLQAVINELSYRRYLEDPATGAPFRLIDPEFKQTVGNVGQIRGFNYSEQGSFVGIEVPSTVQLGLRIGRLS